MLPFETYTDSSGAGATIAVVLSLIWLVLILVAGWKLYVKAGQPGWVAIVPFLNVFGLLKIVKRPMWWFVLLLIPVVNFFTVIVIYNDLSKAFGRGLGTTLALIFFTPITYLVLGFGSAEYQLPKEPLFG